VSSTTNADHTQHILPVKVLVTTWLSLLVLTGVTIAIAQADMGNVNIVVAMGIAATKATIVALFFMHLKYSSRFNSVVLACSIFFAALMIGFVVFDTTAYQSGITAYEQTRNATSP
jgi:cytochrome c oxidase subunit 4